MSSVAGPEQTDVAHRILLVSVRGLHMDVSRCLAYEFEDAITAMDDVFLFAPTQVDRSNTLINKMLKTIGPWTGTDMRLRPRAVPSIAIPECGFELTLVVVQTVRDLRDLMRVHGWQGASPKSICLVEELWVENMTSKDIALLGQFDRIILNCRHSVSPLGARIGKPVSYLPPSVDMQRFCPKDVDSLRPIDAFSMGRRSAQNHQLLIERSRSQDFFYLYDTARFASVLDPAEHRELLAKTIQRAKWFPVNRAKIDEPGLTTTQAEIGFRYFEGAAGGAVMIGERPNAPSFTECFGWKDSVIAPEPGQSILDVIDLLSAEPDRVANIRRRNVAHSLRRHDSSDRYRKILELAELALPPGLKQRADALHVRADALEGEASMPL